jgi:predicted esterase
LYDIEKRQDDRVIMHPKGVPHTSSFIWLHGIGETAYSYVGKFLDEFMELPPDCKIIIPTAPCRFVTDIEEKTYSWFDIRSFHMPDEEDELDNEYFSRSFDQRELK